MTKKKIITLDNLQQFKSKLDSEQATQNDLIQEELGKKANDSEVIKQLQISSNGGGTFSVKPNPRGLGPYIIGGNGIVLDSPSKDRDDNFMLNISADTKYLATVKSVEEKGSAILQQAYSEAGSLVGKAKQDLSEEISGVASYFSKWIDNVVPSEASADNKLADKAFVNNSIADLASKENVEALEEWKKKMESQQAGKYYYFSHKDNCVVFNYTNVNLGTGETGNSGEITIYPASTTTAGVMTAEDKKKLDNISAIDNYRSNSAYYSNTDKSNSYSISLSRNSDGTLSLGTFPYHFSGITNYKSFVDTRINDDELIETDKKRYLGAHGVFQLADGIYKYIDTQRQEVDNSLGKLATKNELDVVETLAESVSKNLGETIERVETIESDYAKQDGNYPKLISGAAYNLEGLVDRVSDSAYHPVGDDIDVKNGVAELLSVRGNAVAWNQLTTANDVAKSTGNFYSMQKIGYNIYFTKTEEQTGTGTIRHTSIKLAPLIRNHKYLARCNKTTVKDTASTSYVVWNAYNSESNQNSANYTGELKPFLFSAQSDATLYFIVYVAANAVIDRTYEGVNVFDLTLIYGAGNEPTTVEQFENDYQKWFGKPLTYEEYDGGSIRPVLATGLKTVGFNLSKIDHIKDSVINIYKLYNRNPPLWENNSGYAGRVHVSFTCTLGGSTQEIDVISKNNKKVQMLRLTYGTNNLLLYVQYTDATYDSHTIGRYGVTSEIAEISNICVNFSWSGKRDGDYEPYWEETKTLPITTLTSGGKVIFPDGLKRAGDVYDEIIIEDGVTKAIKRVGSVDLGSSDNISYQRANNRFVIGGIIPDVLNSTSAAWLRNILCPKYYQVVSGGVSGNTDKVIGVQVRTIYIADDAYSEDVESFKQSLQGVLLYYELATPEVYEIDNFELPLLYTVDDFGTEQVLAPEGAVAPTLVTRYGINAVDTIRRLPDKLEQLKIDTRAEMEGLSDKEAEAIYNEIYK